MGRSKSTCRPNIGEISQFTVEILLLPVSENKRLPCWNSTCSFDFRVCVTIGMSCASAYYTKFCPNRTIRDADVTFWRWRPSAILNFLKVTADHPQSTNEGSSLLLKFRLDRIYNFGDIAIFMFWGFGLKLPTNVVAYAAHAQNQWSIYFRCRN